MVIKGAINDGKVFVECPLCGLPILVKKTKKGKPYFLCTKCGLQAFVRYDQGEERLKTICRRNELNLKKE